MPELPEVENLRLILSPILVGQTFSKIEIRRRNLRFPLPQNLECKLSSATILKITRRAKYLFFDLDNRETLVVHLGMTGRILIHSDQEWSNPKNRRHVIGRYDLEAGYYPQHDHLVFYTKSGMKITYNDQRRFGYILLIKSDRLHKHPMIKNLGVEPFSPEFNGFYLAQRAKGRRSDLKSFLMDQQHIAGLGNIYVCEALFRAGLSPKRQTGTIVDRNFQLNVFAEGLISAVRNVLEEAVAAGGTTLRDFLKPDGSKGAYQNKHRVYDREKKPCVRPGCLGVIRRIHQKGRSTFYCPRCQR